MNFLRSKIIFLRAILQAGSKEVFMRFAVYGIAGFAVVYLFMKYGFNDLFRSLLSSGMYFLAILVFIWSVTQGNSKK